LDSTRSDVAPTTLTSQDELPAPAQHEVENWSENYCFDAFDPLSGLGFWLHLGRWSKQPDLWREQTKIFMPDGTFVVWKTLGAAGESQAGPGAATLSARCVRPGDEWVLRFDGAGRRVTRDQLLSGALADGPLCRLQFEWTFRSTGRPAWGLGADAERQIWATSHYEQHGRVSGEVRVDGDLYRMDGGSGFRDHSRGPRMLTDLQRHLWTHGQFSDGTAFALFHMRVRDSERDLRRACLIDETGIHEATLAHEPPFASSVSDVGKPFSVTLDVPGRDPIEILIRPTSSLPSSFVVPYEKLHGVSGEASHVSVHETAVFEANGTTGAGLVERAFALGGGTGSGR
jgi:hypothetical protein